MNTGPFVRFRSRGQWKYCRCEDSKGQGEWRWRWDYNLTNESNNCFVPKLRPLNGALKVLRKLSTIWPNRHYKSRLVGSKGLHRWLAIAYVTPTGVWSLGVPLFLLCGLYLPTCISFLSYLVVFPLFIWASFSFYGLDSLDPIPLVGIKKKVKLLSEFTCFWKKVPRSNAHKEVSFWTLLYRRWITHPLKEMFPAFPHRMVIINK